MTRHHALLAAIIASTALLGAGEASARSMRDVLRQAHENQVRLQQEGRDNGASVYQRGPSRVVIAQHGRRNETSIIQAAPGNAARVSQYGSGNQALVTQERSGNSACVLQVGNGHAAEVYQSGDQQVGVLQGPGGSRVTSADGCTKTSAAYSLARRWGK
jgi:hypothetical protein